MTSQNKKFFSLAALGVVYGDIGTSPLYALRESLHSLALTSINILGVLSLIFWSLIMVISIKYLIIILRADNEGEGGVLALFALLNRGRSKPFKLFFVMGMLGAGLLLSDGMLTPAISVMSAVEGIKVISAAFGYLVLPLTIIILLLLFASQRFGPQNLGKFFGPILLIWFITIAVLGGYRILLNPKVLLALNPYYAIQFFLRNGWIGYLVLGGVFLAVTGGEALYADLGHFGKRAIRTGWFFVALPALVLNYFGQGAYLLKFPAAINNPFYALAPNWFAYPLLVIATVATIIASQAVISAAFSLTKQAVSLDLYPRVPIIQTSSRSRGQIYVPQMNTILTIGTLALVLTFRNSSALAHAYGIAVNLDMLIVTLMVACLASIYWRWSVTHVVGAFLIFLIIDVAFLGANLHKLLTGGWVPLVFAIICAIVMWTWHKGLEFLRTSFYQEKVDLKEHLTEFHQAELNYLPNVTAIFITDPYDKSGGSLLHYLKLNHIMPQRVLIVSIAVGSYPFVGDDNRYELIKLGKGVFRLILHYGFMQFVDMPTALSKANNMKIFPFKLNIEQITFLIEIIHVTPTTRERTLMFFWQEKLFAFLMRNASLDIEFYHLPYNRTIAIGTYCEI